ncbi:unnamed protein product [Agarophyton chilense]
MTSSLFGPELWEKLKSNPETSSLLQDPAFKKIVDDLRTDPSSLSKHITDPRVLKLITVLSQSTNTGAQPGETVVEDVRATTRDAPMPDVTTMPETPDLSSMGTKERSLYEKDCGTEAYKKRDFTTAIEHYSKALEFNPDNMAFYTNRAAARLESGDVDGAIEDCKAAIKENSERHLRTDFKIIARAYGRMGNAYLKKEDYGQAIEAFEKSLVEYSDPKVTRALREAERIQRKKAEEAYINPELSAKERQEGNELFLGGKFPESIAKYTEAIKRNPKDAAPYSNRAAAYMKLGEFPMAMKDCERCLDIDPTFVKAYIRKGNIHFYMKEYHKCLEVYEKGLKLAPNNKDLRQGLFKTNMKIQEQQNSGEVDQAQMEQAMKDPEIQKILQDPQMNTLLKQMQDDPKFAAQAMRDPTVSSKVQKLIASGILRVA